MLLRRVWCNGKKCDLRILNGEFESQDTAGVLTPLQGEMVMVGGLVCPPFAEPHVHLDATQLGAATPNKTGTLNEGIANWAKARGRITRADVRMRALQTVRWYLRHGTTRIRTHVDTACLPAVEGLLALREELAAGEVAGVPIELHVVAFPQEGILRGEGKLDRWQEVVAMGVDAVGAIPHFERTTEEGWRSVQLAFDLAEKHGLSLDFHCDETDDPGARNLEVVCAEAIDRGFGNGGGPHVVAGHCTALHSYPNPHAAKVIELVAESGVQVIANPLDNVVLQGRYDGYPRRRGITRVDELWAAGASVGIGHDSVVDPWYRLGTANLVDAAHMLVHVAQLTSQEQMERVFNVLSVDNHYPFGDPPEIEVGDEASFLWFDAADPVEVLRLRRPPRVFLKGTEVEMDWAIV